MAFGTQRGFGENSVRSPDQKFCLSVITASVIHCQYLCFKALLSKGFFFFHFKCCIETSLHTKLRGRTCAQNCGQGKLSQSLCASYSQAILPSLPLWGAAITNFYPNLTEQEFNASSWTYTAPHIWWVATVWLWLWEPSAIPMGSLGCFLKELQQSLFLLQFSRLLS